MTVYAIFGKAEASEKLIRASMSELLDSHLQFTPDEPFELVIHSEPLPSLNTVRYWSDDAGVKRYESVDPVADTFEMAKSNARVLALIGDDEPTGDVAQALALATKHQMEIRDLAEAGITYIYVEGDPPTNEEEQDMPRLAEPEPDVTEDVLTWEEIGDGADEGNKEFMEALKNAAIEIGWSEDQVDEADSWSAIAEAIQDYEEVEPEGDVIGADITDEEDQADIAEMVSLNFTPEDFQGKSLKEVRELAVQAGVKDAAKLGKAALVKALCGKDAEQLAEAELAVFANQGEAPQPVANDYGPATLSSADLYAIAEAVADILAQRLAR